MKLAGHSLDLWFANLDCLPVELACLNEDERGRVARKGTEQLQHRQGASLTWLRQRLGEALNTPPAALVIERDDQGKPRLLSQQAYFNLSHSGPVVALALCRSSEVGVDVEHLIKRPSQSLAEEILSEVELSRWASLPEHERQAWLTAVWARKEAVLKAAGVGLRASPSTFSVGGAGDINDEPVSLDGTLWRVRNIEGADGAVPEGYRAAVAVNAASE